MSDIKDELAKATKDLLFQSESDEPFEVFEWKDSGSQPMQQALRGLSGSGESVPVREVALHEFFAPLIEAQDWHGDEEKETVCRYKSLLETITQRLADPKVYKVGEVELDIFVVGGVGAGAFAGIRTKAVET